MTPLWQHQIEGVNLIASKPATYLAWEMGTGKTRAVIEHLLRSKPRRTLVLAPASVVGVWPQQIARFGGHDIRALALGNGMSVARRAQVLQTHLDISEKPLVVIVNYEAAPRAPLADMLIRTQWNVLVCDEAHRLKAPGGVQSRFVARLAKRVPKRVALSGTPCPHSPLDIYAQYRWLDPTIFGTSFALFRSRYAVIDTSAGFPRILRWQNLDDMRRRVNTIMHRVRKTDVLDLPPYTFSDRVAFLSPEAARVYGELEKQFVADLEAGQITAAHALVRLLRLQQITSGCVRLDDGTVRHISDDKARMLAEVLEDVPYEPVVVFARFTHDIDIIHSVAEKSGRPSCELSGRRKDIDAVWTPRAGEVAAVQIHAGGLGIDLSAAHIGVYYSIGFDRGDYEQSLSRLHRHGQNRAVTFVRLIMLGTVDEKVIRVLQNRGELVDLVLQQYRRQSHDGANIATDCSGR